MTGDDVCGCSDPLCPCGGHGTKFGWGGSTPAPVVRVGYSTGEADR